MTETVSYALPIIGSTYTATPDNDYDIVPLVSNIWIGTYSFNTQGINTQFVSRYNFSNFRNIDTYIHGGTTNIPYNGAIIFKRLYRLSNTRVLLILGSDAYVINFSTADPVVEHATLNFLPNGLLGTNSLVSRYSSCCMGYNIKNNEVLLAASDTSLISAPTRLYRIIYNTSTLTLSKTEIRNFNNYTMPAGSSYGFHFNISILPNTTNYFLTYSQCINNNDMRLIYAAIIDADGTEIQQAPVDLGLSIRTAAALSPTRIIFHSNVSNLVYTWDGTNTAQSLVENVSDQTQTYCFKAIPLDANHYMLVYSKAGNTFQYKFYKFYDKRFIATFYSSPTETTPNIFYNRPIINYLSSTLITILNNISVTSNDLKFNIKKLNASL